MQTLLARVAALPYDFPPGTEAVHLASVGSERREEVGLLAAAVTPICTAEVRDLLCAFIAHKRAEGSPAERLLYASMDEFAFFTRLLCKRPISFWGSGDRYILPTTAHERQLSSQQWDGFEDIGGDSETPPLVIENYLSYDEMQISALISVAVPTLFINSGDRSSMCLPGVPGSFQDSGVIVGCVGARLVKEGLMEAEHMLVTPRCDADHGCGPRQGAAGGQLSAWACFYGIEHFPSYEEAVAAEGHGRFHRVHSSCQSCYGLHNEVWTVQDKQYCASCMSDYYGNAPTEPADKALYLDGLVYKRRICATVEPFLVYASQLGSAHRSTSGCGAHVRVKGLGLGAWWVDPVQEALMKDVYAEVLGARDLPGIDVLEFCFFPSEDVPAAPGHIEMTATKCSFADPVGDRLLVTMYAWDGNAYPGNEWWAESGSGRYLGMTDDSAAASCSLISSLQHPVVNAERICAASAQMLTTDGSFVGLLSV